LQELCRAVAEHVAQALVHQNEAPSDVQVGQPHGGPLEHDAKTLLAFAQVGLRLLARERVADGALQGRAVQMFPGQIVLRAVVHGLHANVLTAGLGEHDDGRAGRAGAHAADRFDPLAVGQIECQQDHVGLGARQVGQPAGQSGHRVDPEIGQQFPNQARIGRVVVDQQRADRLR